MEKHQCIDDVSLASRKEPLTYNAANTNFYSYFLDRNLYANLESSFFHNRFQNIIGLFDTRNDRGGIVYDASGNCLWNGGRVKTRLCLPIDGECIVRGQQSASCGRLKINLAVTPLRYDSRIP